MTDVSKSTKSSVSDVSKHSLLSEVHGDPTRAAATRQRAASRLRDSELSAKDRAEVAARGRGPVKLGDERKLDQRQQQQLVDSSDQLRVTTSAERAAVSSTDLSKGTI